MTVDTVQVSKFLSHILRHEPESIGLTLDEQGWAEVDELIRCAREHGHPLTRPLLERVVAENDKQRFALSDDGRCIRANQGHTIPIDLDLPPAEPPKLLYHGTATRHLDSIRQGGLDPCDRQHVHLSLDHETAIKVGQRHGNPTILVIRARDMHEAGYEFFHSENGVWLTRHVPKEFIEFPA